MIEMARNEENYLLQLLQNMQNSIDSLAADVKEVKRDQVKSNDLQNKIHDQTKKTNGKVLTLRKDVDKLQILKAKQPFRFPVLSDRTIQLLAILAVIAVAVIASQLGVSLKDIV